LPEEQRSIANFSIGPLVDKDTQDTDTDIMGILPKLKHNKATGPDRIATEAFIYGTPRLFAHLSIMFSWFLKVGAPCRQNLLSLQLYRWLKLNVDICQM